MSSLTKYWFLEDFDLFKKLGKQKLMQMCDLFEMQQVKKGEELFFAQADQKVVFFLKSGTVKIVSTSHPRTVNLIKKGNIFGELALLSEEEENEEKAVVLESGVVCLIEAEQMKNMMDKFPSLKNAVLKLGGFRIRRLQRQLESLLYKDSATRIREYLFDFVQEFGEKKGKPAEAKNILNHADIANLTNTSRQTVSNVMSKLRKEGVIHYDSKKITWLLT